MTVSRLTARVVKSREKRCTAGGDGRDVPQQEAIRPLDPNTVEVAETRGCQCSCR
jgi:hypothetical protein